MLLHIFSVLLCSSGLLALLDGQGPLLVQEPPPRIEFANSTGGRLECSARGSPEPVVKWLLADGTPANAVAALRYQTANGSLVFPPFSAAEFRPDVHRAVYRCMATNILGKVLSRDVKLRAVVMQDYMVTATNAEVTVGNTAVLRCVLPSFIRDLLTVTSWLQDRIFNIYPSSDGDGKFHMLPTGELVISNAVTADAYSSYQCRVTHRLSGETRVSSAAARIVVKEPRATTPPHFAERIINHEARRDELVVVPCVAEGNPPPIYRWEFGAMTLVDDEQRYTSGGFLILLRARPSDAGRYMCEATNSVGRAQLDVTIVLTAPLSVRVLPMLLTATLGRPAQFRCAVTGYPVVSITWFKNGQPISGLSDGTAEMLSLTAVTKDDQGIYQCFVKNENDMAQGTAELRLGDTPPQLVYSFIRQTIQPGPSVSLKCVATGNPPPVIKWTLDGFSLPQNERFVIGQYVPVHGDVVSHVNITNVVVEDGGTYQCSAINRVGHVTHNAQLNVYGPPYVRPMGEIPAVAGETLRIACPVAGYPIEEIKWYRGERVLPLSTRHSVFPNGTLVIDKVQSGEDDGTYRCVATNKQGRYASETAQVDVTVPPNINPFSFRSDLHLGERVGVQCVVSKGDPPLNVHWLKNGLHLTQNEKEGILVRNLDEFTSVLSIGALARNHEGNYTCMASNAVARTAYSAVLSVNVPPAITPFSFGELSAGERVRVTCSVKRGDPPLYITWLKDARFLPTTPSPHDDPDLMIQDVEEYSSVLAIRSVSSRHSGNYTCMASNRARNTTFTAQLLVTVPPVWVVEPQNGAAILGHEAVMGCQVDGFPKPTITWKKVTGQKPDQYHTIPTQKLEASSGLDQLPRFSGMYILSNGSLYIGTASKEDEGRYVCEANNGIGVGVSAMVDFTVHAPVHFKVQSRKEVVRRGNSAVLRCQALGDLPITFTWRKDGSFIDLKGRTSVKNMSVSEGMESELKIYAAETEDGGIYMCFARNEFGANHTAIHLLVQDTPALPTNVRVLDRESRRVKIAWMPAQDSNSPITRYIIRYSPIKDSWQGLSFQTVVDGNQSSAVVSSLQPDTMYRIRVLAENTLGTGAPSEELLVRTEEESPSAPPQHVNVEATSSTQLLLTWEPPPEDQWNGPLLGHYVGHRQLGDRDTTRRYNFTTVSLRGTGKEDSHLEELKKFCKYGLVVQAFNGKGPGPLSEEVVAQTLEDVPEASPRDVRCTPLSSESLQVSWQPPPEALVHGVIQGYRLLYEPVGSPNQQDVIESRTRMTSDLTAVLHTLRKYTNYSIELLAFTRVGDGVKSRNIYCHTKEDVPEAPSDIKALLQSPDTALVAWLPPTYPNGILTKYHVYVRMVENGHQVDSRSISHFSTSHLQYQLPGLKQQLRYEFRVTAFTKFGEGKSTPVAAISPSPKVSAAIISFGGLRLVTWKSDVRLPCQAVGVPEPVRQWREDGEVPISRQPQFHVSPDGSLLLSNAQRSDQGEYTCHVSNDHGKDFITYHLVVQVPPRSPLLLVTGSTTNSLQLQWKVGDNGGSAVRGFLLHYRLENDDWEEQQLDGSRNTYTLPGLRCGTLYHVFVTAYNRVGNGDPSQTLAVRTRGSPPLRPSSSELFQINSTGIVLHLNTWPDGGCPMTYFEVEYAPYMAGGGDQWFVVGSNIGSDKVLQLVGLGPGTTYKLRITAHNAAGSNVANYVFTTLSESGGTVTPGDVTQTESQKPMHKDLKIVLLAVFSTLAVFMGWLGICFCIKKRSAQNPGLTSSLQDVQASATEENKHNLARREQYYATIRKLPSSPATLECISDYSEDIRPHPTFYVPDRHSSSDTTKLQTFLYREDMSSARKSMESEYAHVKRSLQSDEYDGFDSELETEQGTSSRTESSNHLVDGEIPEDTTRHYNPAVTRLYKVEVESKHIGTDWNQPDAEWKPSLRRYCQAHLLK